jgi:hypothetical protein
MPQNGFSSNDLLRWPIWLPTRTSSGWKLPSRVLHFIKYIHSGASPCSPREVFDDPRAARFKSLHLADGGSTVNYAPTVVLRITKRELVADTVTDQPATRHCTA